ncbi:MAG: sugar phosphate isomerase/epimerase [Planctomycetota bacterium]|nr:MAG: sugar phosphate isomerase/epimerase [Planctomycetota bacterium]REJ97781.1 MAG: sugar phosphate isomerase/epimerase [Planctomycetota bacterium]
MRYAICNEMFGDWSAEKAFALARECGYTGVEIAPFTIDADARRITDAQVSAMRQAAEANDLEVVGLHWLLAKTEGFYLTTADAEVRTATSDYLATLARLCRQLGGSVMVFGSPQQRNLLPGVSHAEATRYAVEVFQAAMPVLEEHDVTLAVEPLGPSEGDFLTTAAEAAALIEQVGSSHCRLHLDVKAMASEAEPIADIIRAQRELVAHFHANDSNLQGPGFGEVDFVPIFRALDEIKYDGWVSVEVFDYEPGVERLARESIEYMRATAEKAHSS